MPKTEYTLSQGANKGKKVAVDFAAIDKLNADNLKKTADGSQVAVSATPSFILIGGGHQPDAIALAKDANCYVGKITVTKGKWDGSNPGTLEVTGISSNRSQFDGCIKRISKKKVIYK